MTDQKSKDLKNQRTQEVAGSTLSELRKEGSSLKREVEKDLKVWNEAYRRDDHERS